MADPGKGTDVTHDTPIKARPTTYKGIEMRSRLEAAYAAVLDRAIANSPELFDPAVWEYEPDCFADEKGQYLPDFAYWMRTPEGRRRVYIEVKPRILDNGHFLAVTERMAIIWASEPDAVLHLAEFDGEFRYWHGVLIPNMGGWWTLTSPERAVA